MLHFAEIEDFVEDPRTEEVVKRFLSFVRSPWPFNNQASSASVVVPVA